YHERCARGGTGPRPGLPRRPPLPPALPRRRPAHGAERPGVRAAGRTGHRARVPGEAGARSRGPGAALWTPPNTRPDALAVLLRSLPHRIRLVGWHGRPR